MKKNNIIKICLGLGALTLAVNAFAANVPHITMSVYVDNQNALSDTNPLSATVSVSKGSSNIDGFLGNPTVNFSGITPQNPVGSAPKAFDMYKNSGSSKDFTGNVSVQVTADLAGYTPITATESVPIATWVDPTAPHYFIPQIINPDHTFYCSFLAETTSTPVIVMTCSTFSNAK
jgi:hypothetical protein